MTQRGTRSRIARTRRNHLLELLEERRLLAAESLGPVLAQSFIHANDSVIEGRPLVSSEGAEFQLEVVGYDPATGIQSSQPVTQAQAEEDLKNIETALATQGFSGIAEFVQWSTGTDQESAIEGSEPGVGSQTEAVFGTDERTNISDTTIYPWRANGRMWMDFGGAEFLARER